MLKSQTLAVLASLTYAQEITGGNEVLDGHMFDMAYR